MDLIAILLFLILILLCIGEILLLITPLDIWSGIEHLHNKTELFLVISYGVLQFQTRIINSQSTNTLLISGHELYRFSAEKSEKEDVKHEKESRSPRFSRDLLEGLVRRGPGLFHDGMRLLGVILSAVSIQKLDVDIRLGFSSPALTGMVYGYSCALIAILSPARRLRIDLTPDFDREVLEGKASLLLRIRYPIRILIALFRFLLEKNTRTLLFDMKRKVPA